MSAASGGEMAAWVGSPASAISRAAPAVSPEMTVVRPYCLMILRHWPSACTWLCTVLIVSRLDARHAEQAELDAQEVLGDDVQPGRRQEVVDVGDAAGDRVVDRDHRELGVAVGDRREDVLERGARHGLPRRGSARSPRCGSSRRALPGRRSGCLVAHVSSRRPESTTWCAVGCACTTNASGRATAGRRSGPRPARARPRPGRAGPGRCAAAEPAAGHAGAERPGLERGLDRDVELGAADLEVVAQRRVRRGEDRAELGPGAPAERVDGGADAGGLGQHVAGAGLERLVGQLDRRVEAGLGEPLRPSSAAARSHSSRRAAYSPSAREWWAPVAMTSSDQPVVLPRRPARSRVVGRRRRGVDQDGVAGLAVQHRELVHQPDGRADEAALGALREQGQVGAVEAEAEQLVDRGGDAARQGGRRRQPRAGRQARLDDQVDAAEPVPGLDEAPHGAGGVRGPAVDVAGLHRRRERRLRRARTIGPHVDDVVIAAPGP